VFEVNYSRALLDSAGIQSVAVSAAVMNTARDVLIREVYRVAHRPVGTSLPLFCVGATFKCYRSSVHSVVSYVLTDEEYLDLRLALGANEITHGEGDEWGTDVMYIQAGVIYIAVDPIGGLAPLGSVPSGWDRLDASYRLVGAGPHDAMETLRGVAKDQGLDRPHGGDTFSSIGAMFNVFGLYESNNYGRDGARGKLQITFE